MIVKSEKRVRTKETNHLASCCLMLAFVLVSVAARSSLHCEATLPALAFSFEALPLEKACRRVLAGRRQVRRKEGARLDDLLQLSSAVMRPIRVSSVLQSILSAPLSPLHTLR